MDDRKMEIISQLMEELKEEMQYGEDDLASRLGRKKPDVAMMSIEAEDPSMESEEEEIGMDLDDDMEEGEGPTHKAKIMGSPEEKLKERLLKMRG